MTLRSFLLFVFAFQLSYGEPVKFTTTELMQNETRATVALLERLHISKKQMADVDTKEVIITYCENLDPGKMYFTQAEVEEFVSRYGRSLDLYLTRGNLTPAFEIYQAFRKHVEERTASSIQSLNQKVDLTQAGFFPTDRKKATGRATARRPMIYGAVV